MEGEPAALAALEEEAALFIPRHSNRMLEAVVTDAGGQGEQRGEGWFADGFRPFVLTEGEGGAQVHIGRGCFLASV